MEWIKKDLKEIIENYINGKNYAKPLMLVVTSDGEIGMSNATVDDCRNWLVENYNTYNTDATPEAADKAQVLLYYRWIDQLNSEYLKYAVNLCRKLQKPTICLINDYEYNKYAEGELDLSDFEVVLCNGDMTPTDLENWLKWGLEDPNKENA